MPPPGSDRFGHFAGLTTILPPVCRIRALWRLNCCALPVCCWGGVGASGKPKFLPPSPPPRGFPELREAGLAASREAQRIHTKPCVVAKPCRSGARPRVSKVGDRVLSSMGNNSPPCVASSPCGVCIVAGCSFCNGEEREHRLSQNFYPRSLRPQFFPSCGEAELAASRREQRIHTLPD